MPVISRDNRHVTVKREERSFAHEHKVELSEITSNGHERTPRAGKEHYGVRARYQRGKAILYHFVRTPCHFRGIDARSS